MKNVVWLLLVLGGFAQAADDIDGMLGCWTDERRSSVEAWSKTGEGDLLGFGVSWNDDGPTSWETLTIRVTDGATTLTAYPGGTKGTAFRRVTSEHGYARFENPEHDFPQVIEYWWTATTLVARISHLDNDRALEFHKTRCNGSR